MVAFPFGQAARQVDFDLEEQCFEVRPRTDGEQVRFDMDECILELPTALEQGHSAMLDWLVDYMDKLDTQCNHAKFEYVASIIEGWGYSSSYNAPVSNNGEVTSDMMARLIMGSAVYDMKSECQPLETLREMVLGYHEVLEYESRQLQSSSNLER